MLNVGLVGGGFITQFYKSAFANSKGWHLQALSDVNLDCYARANNIFGQIPFYIDFTQMLDAEPIDLVYICTPADTHYAIAKNVLERGIPVVCETPVVQSMKELMDLYDIATKHNTYLDVMYPFEYGDEMQLFKDNYKRFGNIQFIHMELYEQYAYTNNGQVSLNKFDIGDAWMGAASNALSNAWHMMEIHNMKKIREIINKDPNGITKYAHKTFVNEYGQKLDILIDQMTSNKTKYSVIQTDKTRCVIDHHNQLIIAGNEIVFNDRPPVHHMHIQYEKAFKDYHYDQNSRDKAITIMEILTM